MISSKMALRLLLACVLTANVFNYAASEETDGIMPPKFNSNIDWAGMTSGNGRKLLQASANAVSFSNEVTTGAAQYCNIYTSANEPDTCPSQAPYPACCNGQYCYSNSDGHGGTCGSSASKPACCPAFNQKPSVCISPDSDETCSLSTRPAPACCDGSWCDVNKNGDGGVCTSGTAKCCPA